MSASLVGSEMCIRDSTHTHPPLGGSESAKVGQAAWDARTAWGMPLSEGGLPKNAGARAGKWGTSALG
eukprot:13180624-Alexandrium_andersonii.AAC.1